MKKHFSKIMLAALLAVPMVACESQTPKGREQTVEEGSLIRDENQKAADTLEDLQGADVNTYVDCYATDGVKGFRVTKVQPDIYHVDEDTGKTEAGLTNNASSMYFVIGEKEALMVDGGNGENGNAYFSNEVMDKIIKSLVGDRQLTVALTHSHGDHTGYFVDPKSVETLGDVEVYINEDDLASLAEGVKTNYNVKTFKNGETVKLGPVTYEIVSLRGHTDGSCAMIDRENEIIIAGDALGSGTLWLFGEDNLVDLKNAMGSMIEAVKDMKNPVVYAGHRYQQRLSMVHTYGISVNEMGKNYILEMQSLLDHISDNDYVNNVEYDKLAGNRGNYAIYSLGSDLNGDGMIPGIYVVPSAVEKLQSAQ